ncbi:MAG: TolC family protein, partial [Deltaproteobacteria bacterium]|nr:TolC family protein [Deltaproteobacteria bacterium]
MRITSILSVLLMFFLTSITFADEWGKELPHSMLHMDSALKKAFNDSTFNDKSYKITKLLTNDSKVTSDNQSLLHSSRRGIVKGNRVNLRYGPSTKERVVLTMIGKGKPVEVLGQQGEWYRVKAGSDEGWIYRTLVTLEQEKSTVASLEDHGTLSTTGDDINQFELTTVNVDSQVLAKVATVNIAASDSKTKNKAVLKGSTARSEDLMQAYKLAQESDPTFQSETYRHEASPETLKQAYSEIWPTVSADGSYQRTRQEIHQTGVAVYGQELARYPSKGYNLTLTQPIFRYSSFMRILQAKEEVKQADFEFEKAKQDLILRVVEAYIGSLEAQDNLEFTRAEEDAIKLHFELAQERYKSGLAPITDFHDAKARLAYIMARRVKAENLLDD